MKSLEAAMRWLSEGIAVIPCVAKDKVPALNRWRPYQRRLPRVDELRLWFSNGYNLAVITGWRNLVVIDWDDMGKYADWLDGLSFVQRAIVAATYRVRTARGLHIYLYTAENTQTRPGPGVDIKASHGYVLSEPSVHPSGHRYRGIGSINRIGSLDSIDELLPPPATPSWGAWGVRHTEPQDPFDAAMCKSAKKSDILFLKTRWRMEDLLPGLPQHPGVRKVKCPFHDDGQASLAIYPDQRAHCFGCSFHGDVIDLYAALNKLSLADAVKEMMP